MTTLLAFLCAIPRHGSVSHKQTFPWLAMALYVAVLGLFIAEVVAA